MNRKKYRLAAAAVSALAIGLLGTGAPAAFADVDDPYAVNTVNQEAANKALINPLGDVQLSIHKYLGAPSNPVDGWGDGTAQTIPSTYAPLSGVKFDVYQVFYDAARLNKVDLTTNAGWTAAAAINSYIPTQTEIRAGAFTIDPDGTGPLMATTYYLGTATQVKTADGTNGTVAGTATFTKVDGVGFYLVNENIPASTMIINETTDLQVPTLSVTPTQPFFVTLPKTNPTDTNRWMYDVNVYPKNQSDVAMKAVTTQGTNTAENGNTAGTAGATYTVTTGITDGLTGPQMGMYVVYDNLDPRLDFTSTSVALSGTTPPALVRCETVSETACDYQVWVGADAVSPATSSALTFRGTDSTVTGGPIVQIVFTDAGLVKLAANSSATVVTTINTTVNAEGLTGVIPNQATFIPNQGSWEANPGNWGNPETPGTSTPTTPTTGTPSTMTQLKYGDLIITKQDPAMTAGAADMEGAEFAVYATPKGTATCTDAVLTGTPIATGVIPTTPGIDNKVTIKGLETSDFYLNATQTLLQYYCLVETKAPVGYNLLAQPISFTVMQAFDNTANPPAPILATFAQTMNNEKANLGNNLPLTGGEGVAALSLGGLALIGGGAGYYAYTSRKRRTA